jgi:colanic acid/amylovoran biosynthesis glycosyltransferase
MALSPDGGAYVNMVAKPKVIIFSDHLLYPSETFIKAQASALCEYEPVYGGSRRVVGLELPQERVYTVSSGGLLGKFRELRFKILGSAPALVKRLGALRPVLLHAHYGPNGLRALPLASTLRLPLITTFHGGDVTITDLRHQKTYLGFRYYLANKAKLKTSDAIFIAVSKFVRRKLLEQGFPGERVLVEYTGVDTKKFRPAPAPPEDRPIILFVGRLVEFKGAEFLIKAASEVQRQFPEVELVLIGDGPLRKDLEKLAKQALRRYRFLGVRTPEEVCNWMKRASVLCMPSITTRSGEAEGFGMVCAEAQAVGKPVVAFDSGGIPEIISHANTGFLAAERDWQALAEYLMILLQNPELRERFGRAGREAILRQFDLQHCTRQLERVYGMVLGTQTAGREENRWHASAVKSCS